MRGLALGLVIMIECSRTPYEYGSSGTGEASSTGSEAGSTTAETTTGGPFADSTSDSSDSSTTGPDALACDIAAQDCPPGEKCTFSTIEGYEYDSTRCVPIVEDAVGLEEPCMVVGDPYSGEDTCGIRTICWYVDEDTAVGRCIPICGGVGPFSGCISDQYVCQQSAGGVLGLCFPHCDPLGEDCTAVEVCVPTSSTFLCYPLVVPGIPAGEACEFLNVCEPGTFCGNPDVAAVCDQLNAGCCVPFCNVDDPGTTCETFDPTTSCVPWYSDGAAPPEHAHVGACALPEE